jgi:SAM-dependent methyltransferase
MPAAMDRMKRLAIRLLPATRSPRLKAAGRAVRWFPAEVAERVRGRDPLTPPRWQRVLVGEGDFHAIGDELLRLFREHAGLRRHEDVLDMGCGVGRIAVPLTRYLDRTASYAGFDVVPYAIQWCRREITPRFPNFRFELADVHNSFYNPKGGASPDDYRFPYEASSFDFAFATSLFTHLLPAGVENYLAEAARVLRPGGRLVATFFVIDDESERRIAAGESDLPFQPTEHGFSTIDPYRYETAVGYSEQFITEALKRSGLELTGPIHRGNWSGRPGTVTYQDLLVARRSSTT